LDITILTAPFSYIQGLKIRVCTEKLKSAPDILDPIQTEKLYSQGFFVDQTPVWTCATCRKPMLACTVPYIPMLACTVPYIPMLACTVPYIPMLATLHELAVFCPCRSALVGPDHHSSKKVSTRPKKF
jgi:hypothetical protein